MVENSRRLHPLSEPCYCSRECRNIAPAARPKSIGARVGHGLRGLYENRSHPSPTEDFAGSSYRALRTSGRACWFGALAGQAPAFWHASAKITNPIEGAAKSAKTHSNGTFLFVFTPAILAQGVGHLWGYASRFAKFFLVCHHRGVNPPNEPPSPNHFKSTSGARFQTTHWSMVLKAGQGADEALLKLCRNYWLPLYAYTRRRGHDTHEAQDLTQGFFFHLLENRGFATVAPERGRFRSFLLVALKHYLDNEWHKARAQKRGGGQTIVSWDELQIDEGELVEPKDDLSPERMFDRRWALTLLDRAMRQLEKECAASRKADLFDALKGHLTGEAEDKPYRGLAIDLGMSEGAVKVALHRLRKRFGELVRDQIERTVATPAEVEDEIRYLFAALG